MTATDLDAFVERVRARRAASGRPDRLDDVSLYRILDGILERGTVPTEVGTVRALDRSTITTPDNRGRND
jgi:hypothetical protein